MSELRSREILATELRDGDQFRWSLDHPIVEFVQILCLGERLYRLVYNFENQKNLIGICMPYDRVWLVHLPDEISL